MKITNMIHFIVCWRNSAKRLWVTNRLQLPRTRLGLILWKSKMWSNNTVNVPQNKSLTTGSLLHRPSSPIISVLNGGDTTKRGGISWNPPATSAIQPVSSDINNLEQEQQQQSTEIIHKLHKSWRTTNKNHNARVPEWGRSIELTSSIQGGIEYRHHNRVEISDT